MYAARADGLLDFIYYTDFPLLNAAVGLVDIIFIVDALSTLASADPGIIEASIMAHSSPLNKPCQAVVYYRFLSESGVTGPHVRLNPHYFCHDPSHHTAFADRLSLIKLNK